jgi:hypothetical protein
VEEVHYDLQSASPRFENAISSVLVRDAADRWLIIVMKTNVQLGETLQRILRLKAESCARGSPSRQLETGYRILETRHLKIFDRFCLV